jgi:STE24 endopeptidase
MHLVLMLLLALACIPRSWPDPLGWTGWRAVPGLYAAVTWSCALGLIALAAKLTHSTCWELRLHPGRRGETLYQFMRGRRRHQRLLYLFLLVSVYLFGWGATVQRMATFDGIGLLPGAELLIIAPFLVAQIASWAILYEVEETDRQTVFFSEIPVARVWDRGEYVRFHLRQNLALVAPAVVLLVAMKGLLRVFPSLEENPYFGLGVLACMPVIFCVLPAALRHLLGLRPLPPGPLRDRLEACATRLKFRHSDILIWDTHNTIGTAMVAPGLFPMFRFVMFTDLLIKHLTPEEVEAVFGHELGHVKHRHMPFYMGFLAVSVLVMAGVWNAAVTMLLPSSEKPNEAGITAVQTSPEVAEPVAAASALPGLDWDASVRDLQVVPLVTILGAYIFVVFGFLSRRCERQADIFGCRAVSCARAGCVDHDPGTPFAPGGTRLCPAGIRTFIGALEKVATINGINRSRPGWILSWQHSTIARRVEFLQRLQEDPTLEPRFQRTVLMVKCAVLLGLGAVLWCLLQVHGWKSMGLF